MLQGLLISVPGEVGDSWLGPSPSPAQVNTLHYLSSSPPQRKALLGGTFPALNPGPQGYNSGDVAGQGAGRCEEMFCWAGRLGWEEGRSLPA